MIDKKTKKDLINTWGKQNVYGFTLIELLVVIALIALIVAISLFGIQNARKTSRDTKRRADLEQIRSALELYKADCGSYPVNGAIIQGGTLVGNGTGSCALTNTYIQVVPSDPIPTQKYTYLRDGISINKYYLCAALETLAGGGVPPGCYPICSNDDEDPTPVNCNYMVINP